MTRWLSRAGSTSPFADGTTTPMPPDPATASTRADNPIRLFTMSSSWWTAIRRCDLANLQELDLTLLVTNAPPGSRTERTYGWRSGAAFFGCHYFDRAN